MVTVAVAGIGRWGKNLVRCFDELAEVTYCCHTGTEANARWVRDEYPHVTCTQEFDQVLRDDTVDAVVIATPIDTHVPLTERAIEAGKDVFVEKPLATEAEEARALVERAMDGGQRLFTGYVFLYAPAFQLLRQKVSDDPVTHLRADWEKFGSFSSPLELSLTCHDIAIGHMLFDAPFEFATVTERVGIRTQADLLQAIFETADGREMVASYDRTSRENRKSIIAVTENGLRYEFVDDSLFVLTETGHEELVPAATTEPLLAECSAFLEWTRGGERPPSGGAFAARVNEALELL